MPCNAIFPRHRTFTGWAPGDRLTVIAARIEWFPRAAPEKAARFVLPGLVVDATAPMRAPRLVPTLSAADLKFLQWLLRIRDRNFKLKAALGLKFAGALCFPKFV
jgi:hypothetical protein